MFFFYMKELIRGAILSQNRWRSQGVAEGTRAPSIEMPPMAKICQKSLVFSFSVFFKHLCVQQYLRTTVINTK